MMYVRCLFNDVYMGAKQDIIVKIATIWMHVST